MRNGEGRLVYGGETMMEIEGDDYDKYSDDDLIATGVLQVEQFCQGFEGMLPLSAPGKAGKKQKSTIKPMMIVIGVQWDPLPFQDPRLTVAGGAQALTQGGT